jgi:hypothetical protein
MLQTKESLNTGKLNQTKTQYLGIKTNISLFGYNSKVSFCSVVFSFQRRYSNGHEPGKRSNKKAWLM